MTRAERIGDRAIRLGYAAPQAVERALAEQQQRLTRDGKRVPLGALLVQMGAIAPAQLATLLDSSALSGFHLAEDAVRLAATIQPSLSERTRTLMFAGCLRHDGASVVAAQTSLALALMEHGPVLLIDADFHQPTQHERFKTDLSPGLADVLAGRASLDEAVRETGVANLQLLTAGAAGAGAVAQLLSDRAASMLENLRNQRPVTLVDAPPLLERPESAMLGSRVDAAVLTLAQGKRGEGQLREAQRLLHTLKVPILGVVLTHRS